MTEQWAQIEAGLPEGWAAARLRLRPAEPSDVERGAALLASLGAGRAGGSLDFSAARRGPGPGPEAVGRALGRLDAERIAGELELVAAQERAAEPEQGPQGLAPAWDRELAALPVDWSDLHVEVALRSSDHVARAALLMSPLNPARDRDRSALRFRVARAAGYGASPGMARRVLERLDEAGIHGSVSILRALADTRHVQTQGPVWYVGGKAV